MFIHHSKLLVQGKYRKIYDYIATGAIYLNKILLKIKCSAFVMNPVSKCHFQENAELYQSFMCFIINIIIIPESNEYESFYQRRDYKKKHPFHLCITCVSLQNRINKMFMTHNL